MGQARRAQTPWTEEEKAVVKAGRKKGMAASAIASQLPGRTRNSVVALAHREGYDTPVPAGWTNVRHHGHRKVAAGNPDVLVVKEAPKVQPLPPPLPPAPDALNLPLEELGRKACHYVVSAPGEPYRYCGAPGHPWCEHHRARVYRKAVETVA